MYVLLPVGLRVAQPCRYCFYSLAQKWVFRPAGATRCPDKREIWHGGADLQFYVYRGENVGKAPKTVKISNFGHKFVPQGRLVCNFFNEILSVVENREIFIPHLYLAPLSEFREDI